MESCLFSYKSVLITIWVEKTGIHYPSLCSFCIPQHPKWIADDQSFFCPNIHTSSNLAYIQTRWKWWNPTCIDRSWNMKNLCHDKLQLLRYSCFRNPTNLIRGITPNNKVSKEGLEIILSLLAHTLASLESFSPVWPHERNDSHLNYCKILRQQWPYLLISLKYSLFFLPFLLFLYYHRLSDMCSWVLYCNCIICWVFYGAKHGVPFIMSHIIIVLISISVDSVFQTTSDPLENIQKHWNRSHPKTNIPSQSKKISTPEPPHTRKLKTQFSKPKEKAINFGKLHSQKS